MVTPVCLAADLRRIEALAADQPLMQRAGRAIADLAGQLCAERGRPMLILAGPGNNGGDAFEAARLLTGRFFTTRVVFAGRPDRLPPDAAAAYRRFAEAGGTTLSAIPPDERWSLIVDGLFGIGLKREVDGVYAGQIAAANALAVRDRCPVLAIDCPSGLDADTGSLRGAVIRASHTLSFIAGKAGLYTADGPDHCGRVTIAPIDIAPLALAEASGRLVAPELFAGRLQARARNTHKGSFGAAGIIGGAPGMAGAAVLAARAALRLGSGRVLAALRDEGAPVFDSACPELMLTTPDRLLRNDALTALACGPGLGSGEGAQRLSAEALASPLPLVLDADALNAVAASRELRAAAAARSAPTLLTPHPAEAGRLLGCGTAEIQRDRVGAARELAGRFAATVALKGCGTIIVAPDGRWFVNANGNPGLATAGSGDVLTGIVVALLAQGWPALDALLAAVHLHACAADDLVARGIGPVGLAAGELIDAARTCLNRWIDGACG